MATYREPLPEFDGSSLGAIVHCRPDINSRRINGILLRVEGTKTGQGVTDPTFAEYIEYVEILQDGKAVSRFVPALQAKAESYKNSNDDTLGTACMVIPFMHPGYPWSAWGTADISKLVIAAKIAGANPTGKTLTRIKGSYNYTPVETPVPRGDVFVSNVVQTQLPSVGWNRFSDVEVKDIIAPTMLIFNNADVEEVRVSIGSRTVYHMTKEDALEELAHNPIYKVPATDPTTIAEFPVMFDVMGFASDFPSLIENGVRRPLNIEYKIKSGATPAVIDILVEGLQRGAQTAVAAAAA